MNKTANPALPIAVLALVALALGAVDDAPPTAAAPAASVAVAAATASAAATATAIATTTPTASAAAISDQPIAAPLQADAPSTPPEVYVVDNPRLAASLRVRKPPGLTPVRWLDSNQR